MLGIFNIIIFVCYLSQGHGNRKTRGPPAWAMPRFKYWLQISQGQNARERVSWLGWAPPWLAAGTSILWLQTFLIRGGGTSNSIAKQAALLETTSQKWPVHSPGPAKTLVASGLWYTKTPLFVCLNFAALGDEMRPGGSGHCIFLLLEYQFVLK